MREGWEYKTIEKCTSIEYGTRVVQKRDGGTIYPVYGGGGETFRMDRYNREDCLIIARFAMSPRCVRYVAGKFFLNDSGLSVKSKEELEQAYLNYHLLFFNDVIYHLGKGAAQRNLDVKAFRQLVIAIPPKSTQLSIVSELDKLNELIRIKKEQLKDYDTLAQSIFYEMFGDPVENEKGWEVKKFGEIGTLERGAGISKKDFVDDGLPCIHYGQLHTTFGAYTRKNITFIPKDLLPKYKIAHSGDLILAITSEDVEGSCKSTAWLGDYDVVVGSDAAIFHHNQNGIYLSYYTRTKAFYNEKAKYAKGFKVTHISTKEIASISICVPPLSIQNIFANKIEQIEKQKAIIQNIIMDLETLLASRMQYWFD